MKYKGKTLTSMLKKGYVDKIFEYVCWYTIRYRIYNSDITKIDY